MEFGDIITVVRDIPGGIDPETEDLRPGTTISFPVQDCVIAPRGGTTAGATGSAETFTATRDLTTTGRDLYAPYGTDVRQDDRITHRGITYTVEGNPAQWHSPLSDWEAGLVASLEVVTGPRT